ncbi:hypothetical protein [Helicobacter ailurogastricus]|uniref:Uncharacterized protein n=1 Tax=Helicobacter ailurogastricus TaxID=1578720 RepID=A0A0K2Y472_9HELI|nr:hypothetical protein [Helicobacter ailurogastricus]BDQ28956.1 hypothetical protein ASB7_07930 [Helicobacter ailurogastricus]CRI32464.1 hypothetical protein HAL07_09390 [Helicobacter ailurogastricus]
MLQKVKNISYLCKVAFNLDEEKKQLAILPAGAEVISTSLQIVEPLAGCTIDLGVGQDLEYFLNNVDCAAKDVADTSMPFCALKNEVVVATITGFKSKKEAETKPAAGPADPKALPAKPAAKEEKDPLCILRMHYFLPSEITLEV